MATKKYVSLDKLGLYDEKIKKVISDGDAAALVSAKEYADGLATNYDAAGAAATVQGKLDEEVARAKAAEELNAAAAKKAQDDVDALAEKVGTVAEGSTVVGMIDAVDAIADANAVDIATMKGQIDALEKGTYDDTEVRNLISGLDTNKADKTQVATDIADAVKAEEDARKEAVQAVQDELDGFEADYADDKAAIDAAIALKADQTALEAVSTVANAAATKEEFDATVEALEAEDARIVGLVEAEAAKAREEEGKLDARLEEVEAFFKLAEGESLDTALDTLVEIQTYLDGEGAVADQMILDIAANKKAIEDHVAIDHDFAGADATLKAELNAEIAKKADATVVEAIDGRVEVLEGEMDAVEGKVATLEGEMDAVEAAVATKAEAQALADAVAALEGVDAGQETRIAAIEAKFGGAEGSVEDMIADAKQEAIDAAAGDATTKANNAKDAAIAKANELNTAMDARVAAVEAASATHALASDLTALAGRMTTAEGEIDTLQSEMDAVEALAAAADAAVKVNASAIALKASQADLEAVSGRVTTLETWHNNFTEVSEEEINALFA